MSENITILISELFLPLIMLLTGFFLWKFPPSYKGMGYHTSASESSPEAWLAAQKYCGFRMMISNIALLVATVISWVLCVIFKVSDNGMAFATVLKTTIGVALILVIIFMTELMLHRCFRKNSTPK